MTIKHLPVKNLLSQGTQTQPPSQPELAAVPTSQLSKQLSKQLSEGEPIRHILLGSPGGVRQTIHLLHTLRYVENALWSPLVPIPNDQLIITPKQGDVMSILIKHVH